MSRFELLADDLASPEGPVAMPDGSVILVESRRGQISRVWPDGRKDVVAVTGGAPNGLAFGPDGMLYCVNNGGFQPMRDKRGREYRHSIGPDFTGGWVERIDIASGAVEVLYRSGDFDCPLRGPNDIVFDSQGGFWFTDHGKMDFGSRRHDIVGIFYALPDGSQLDEVVFPLHNPNGIGLSPDEKRLYVAETYTSRLLEFDVTAPGKVDQAATPHGPARTLYRPEGSTFFDSLAVEENGNICVATIGTGGISVVSPDGKLVEFVETGDLQTTNICFGGPDMRDAYITLGGTGRLVKTRWSRPGLALNFQPR